MSNKTLLVLAAGLGSRYGGIKQIAPIGEHGEILLHYAIHDAVLAGFDKIVFIIKRDIEDDFKKAIGPYAEGKAKVEYTFQDEAYLPQGYVFPKDRKKMLGTVQAILSAKDVIHEPFAVINADDYYGRDAYATMSAYLDELRDMPKDQACMVGYRLINTISYNGKVNRGVCVTDESGNLSGLSETYDIFPEGKKIYSDFGTTEQRELDPESIVSMNLWGFLPEIFGMMIPYFDAYIGSLEENDLKSEYVIPTMIDDMIKDKELNVKVLPCDATWLGITYPTDRQEVSEKLIALQKEGFYPETL